MFQIFFFKYFIRFEVFFSHKPQVLSVQQISMRGENPFKDPLITDLKINMTAILTEISQFSSKKAHSIVTSKMILKITNC